MHYDSFQYTSETVPKASRLRTGWPLHIDLGLLRTRSCKTRLVMLDFKCNS